MLSSLIFVIKNRKSLKNDKTGDLELDQIGKLIIALVLLVVLIMIITFVISGGFSDQEEEIGNVFTNMFR